MLKSLIYIFIVAFLLSIISGNAFIRLLKKKKAGQPILEYVKTHKDKNGTPTMGGLFFILSAVVTFLIFKEENSRLATVSVFIGLSYMMIGFLDDFIKIKSNHNLGLKAYQKIFFQLSIALSSGLFIYLNGMTSFYIPFTKKTIDLGVWSIFIVVFIFIAITNSVNLTDGLDGLVGNQSIVYLAFISALIVIEMQVFASRTYQNEQENLIRLSVSIIGALFGFLIYNTNKASIFMGDTGSLSLGGFIGAISIFSLNSFFIPLLGIMFVISSISVIVQVVWYKRTKRRVFLMAPLHHHFQMKGYSEQKISFCYSVITLVVGIICLFSYL